MAEKMLIIFDDEGDVDRELPATGQPAPPFPKGLSTTPRIGNVQPIEVLEDWFVGLAEWRKENGF